MVTIKACNLEQMKHVQTDMKGMESRAVALSNDQTETPSSLIYNVHHSPFTRWQKKKREPKAPPFLDSPSSYKAKPLNRLERKQTFLPFLSITTKKERNKPPVFLFPFLAN